MVSKTEIGGQTIALSQTPPTRGFWKIWNNLYSYLSRNNYPHSTILGVFICFNLWLNKPHIHPKEGGVQDWKDVLYGNMITMHKVINEIIDSLEKDINLGSHFNGNLTSAVLTELKCMKEYYAKHHQGEA